MCILQDYGNCNSYHRYTGGVLSTSLKASEANESWYISKCHTGTGYNEAKQSWYISKCHTGTGYNEANPKKNSRKDSRLSIQEKEWGCPKNRSKALPLE